MSIDAHYTDMVSRLVKPGRDIMTDLDPKKAEAMHMAIGVAGEAGELLDAIKKHVIYNKPLDINNLIEELGDIEFFIEGIRQIFSLNRVNILEENIYKLSKRYGSGTYSNEQAQTRADKAKVKTINEIKYLVSVVEDGLIKPINPEHCTSSKFTPTCEKCKHFIGTSLGYVDNVTYVLCGIDKP